MSQCSSCSWCTPVGPTCNGKFYCSDCNCDGLNSFEFCDTSTCKSAPDEVIAGVTWHRGYDCYGCVNCAEW
ncbi:hypothetical protein RclHR1_01370025 [Rhizophagus clarus]|uniref:Uncharacterized protein n=1 Tax=Rhizophagus clarus TaxID=94130 RepID=A0A2Z6R3A2_9GLOM|nr:hypothetical protein RclHR1_01370025 [Rhizophagus clarus]GES77310.1 hypothetical protein RCL_jg12159.t1 [Rhizophagus clarus]